MERFVRTATDTVDIHDRIESTVRRHGAAGTATAEVVDRVHRQEPAVPPARIRAAVWDLVGSGRLVIEWDSKLYSSEHRKPKAGAKVSAGRTATR